MLAHVRSSQAIWDPNMPPDDYARLINPRQMPAPLHRMVGQIRQRTAAFIRADYGISNAIYSDTLQLTRWEIGHNQRPHADGEEPDGSPNMFPWRAFASIIYLNDDFDGGQIYFPKLQLEPEIRPGMLAYFPGTAHYLHGVRAITRGTRYTLASFYSFDPSRHDGNPI